MQRGDRLELQLVNHIGKADVQIDGPLETNLHYHGMVVRRSRRATMSSCTWAPAPLRLPLAGAERPCAGRALVPPACAWPGGAADPERHVRHAGHRRADRAALHRLFGPGRAPPAAEGHRAAGRRPERRQHQDHQRPARRHAAPAARRDAGLEPGQPGCRRLLRPGRGRRAAVGDQPRRQRAPAAAAAVARCSCRRVRVPPWWWWRRCSSATTRCARWRWTPARRATRTPTCAWPRWPSPGCRRTPPRCRRGCCCPPTGRTRSA